jgi:hypothetical protein
VSVCEYGEDPSELSAVGAGDGFNTASMGKDPGVDACVDGLRGGKYCSIWD